MPAMYDRSGTENLRATPQVFGPSAANPSTASGADVGGTANLKAQATVLTGPAKRTDRGTDDTPALTFRDGVV